MVFPLRLLFYFPLRCTSRYSPREREVSKFAYEIIGCHKNHDPQKKTKLSLKGERETERQRQGEGCLIHINCRSVKVGGGPLED